MRLSGLTMLSGAVAVMVSTVTCQITPLPVNFGLLLFPDFETLDVFGPIDVFNLLSKKFKINLYIIAETMDPVSTGLRGLTGIGSNFSESVVPTHTFLNAPPLDVLIVPGGGGDLSGVRSPYLGPTRQWIVETVPSLQYLLTICTGSALVASTGVLDGRNATTNKYSWAWATSQGPKVNWVAKARWTVDGNFWTSSGVTAGLDAAYAFVETIFGTGTSDSIAEITEYTRQTDPHNDPWADYFNVSWPIV